MGVISCSKCQTLVLQGKPHQCPLQFLVWRHDDRDTGRLVYAWGHGSAAVRWAEVHGDNAREILVRVRALDETPDKAKWFFVLGEPVMQYHAVETEAP